MKKYIWGIVLIIAIAAAGTAYYLYYIHNDDLSETIDYIKVLDQPEQANCQMETDDIEGNINTALFDGINNKDKKAALEALNAGADANYETPDGVTPLFMAILNQDPDMVELLIKKGANVNKANSNNWVPLAMAVLNSESADIIRLLVQNGANQFYRFETGMSFWEMAMFSDRPYVVFKAMKDAGMNINEVDAKGNNLLITAIRTNKSPQIIKIFIDAGIDVNKVDEEKRTPLMLALYMNADKEIIKMLVDNGAEYNDENGDALYFATVYNKQPEVLDLFKAKGVDLCAPKPKFSSLMVQAVKDNVGVEMISKIVKLCPKSINDVDEIFFTPLMYSVLANQDFEVVKFLVDNGADVNYKNEYDVTVLMLALEGGAVKETVNLLIEKGADPFAINKNKISIIDYMAQFTSDEEVASKILDLYIAKGKTSEVSKSVLKAAANQKTTALGVMKNKKVKADAVDENGLTPLLIAAASPWTQKNIPIIVEMDGLNINAQDKTNGATALIYAVVYGADPSIIKQLIENKADVNLKDRFGNTPLLLAAMQSPDFEVVSEMLIKAGADEKAETPDGLTYKDIWEKRQEAEKQSEEGEINAVDEE